MTAPPLPPLPAPPWPHCGEEATTVDPIGCLGRQIPGEPLCLAHLAPATRASYLATLSPGDDIDHRGTTFTDSLLAELLHVLRDPTSSRPHLGRGLFDGAMFSADAAFVGAMFSADAAFVGATFSADAAFDDATFSADARFVGAMFSADAAFVGATFSAHASFDGAMFSADAWFVGAMFSADARFVGATFSAAPLLGPLVCQGRLDLSGAAFVAPVTIEAAAVEVRCGRTRWESTATLRLRYAEVDLTDAVVTQPIAVTAHTAPFATRAGIVADETALTDTAGVQLDPGVRISSLRGVDAAHLVLTNTDLTECRFFGAFHLDQLRLEGETVFARTPGGTDVLRGIPLRWTDRLALAEERHWRALPEHRRRLRVGWSPAPPEPGPAACPPGPPALAALYRQLRKAFEDGKDEPGAADFCYAEVHHYPQAAMAVRRSADPVQQLPHPPACSP
ncbi:pentapeptide repeat-containing protein [Streptomyces syringium]|uniref:pentapeptide repeat-containing protein n=1 Tax=Streptomyces syringium TaxID=76729 RepID=UPI00340033E9